MEAIGTLVRRQIIFLILVISVCKVIAQPAIELGAQGVLNYPEVADNFDIISISFYVVNTGNVAFNDTIVTRQSVNGNTPKSIDLTETVFINPGDSSLVTINGYNFMDPDFNLARNGIVIWVTDENLTPTPNQDTLEFFLTSGPAFRIGSLGISGFPIYADTSTNYSFDIHVENNHQENYADTLYVLLKANGNTSVYQSAGPVLIPGLSSIVYNQSLVTFEVPPYLMGMNDVKIWVQGTGDAMAIDTVDRVLYVGPVTSNDNEVLSQITTWPNPIAENAPIRIQSSKLIKEVEVYSFDGRLLRKIGVEDLEVVMPSEGLGHGYFMLSIHMEDDERVLQKMFIYH